MKALANLEKWWFRLFSQETVDDEDYWWVRIVVVGIMIWTGFGAMVFDMSHKAAPAKVLFIIYTIEIFLFAFLWLIVWFYHNWRIKHEDNEKI